MEDKRQEDLDTVYIFSSIKKGLIGLFNSIVWLFRFSYKKFFRLALFILAGVGIGLLIYFLARPYYSSHLSVSHIRFENDYCKELITSLNSDIAGSPDNADLARKLMISPADAEKVKSIKYFPLNDHIAERYADSASVLLPFKVEVQVYDNDVLDTLQSSILHYLESNEFATKRKQLEKQALDNTEKKIKDEIQENDSLRTLVNKGIVPRASGNGIILGQPIDPVAVYERGLDLYERQLLINKKQQLNNSFELLVGFTKSSEPANSGLGFYVIMGILIGYLVGIIWLLNREFSSAVK